MDDPQTFPPYRSYSLHPGLDGDPLPALLDGFHQSGYAVQRDVEIGMPGDGTSLVARTGDFWFHSDGAFLETPPRWIVIQVLEAETGGSLEILPVADLPLPRGESWFGKPQAGIAAPVADGSGDERCFRYRRDYMHSVPDGADLPALHEQIEAHALVHAVAVGELRPRDCLVVDNWCVLHRRRPFRGRRVIRRLWLGG